MKWNDLLHYIWDDQYQTMSEGLEGDYRHFQWRSSDTRLKAVPVNLSFRSTAALVLKLDLYKLIEMSVDDGNWFELQKWHLFLHATL